MYSPRRERHEQGANADPTSMGWEASNKKYLTFAAALSNGTDGPYAPFLMVCI